MEATLRREQAPNKISQHCIGTGEFQSWLEGKTQKYDILTSNTEPEMIHWGFCNTRGAYFISDEVPVLIRIPILQMTHHQMHHDLSQLEAIQFAFRKVPTALKRSFISTLKDFYGPTQASLETSGDPRRQLPAINEVMEFLRSQS